MKKKKKKKKKHERILLRIDRFMLVLFIVICLGIIAVIHYNFVILGEGLFE